MLGTAWNPSLKGAPPPPSARTLLMYAFATACSLPVMSQQ